MKSKKLPRKRRRIGEWLNWTAGQLLEQGLDIWHYGNMGIYGAYCMVLRLMCDIPSSILHRSEAL